MFSVCDCSRIGKVLQSPFLASESLKLPVDRSHHRKTHLICLPGELLDEMEMIHTDLQSSGKAVLRASLYTGYNSMHIALHFFPFFPPGNGPKIADQFFFMSVEMPMTVQE